MSATLMASRFLVAALNGAGIPSVYLEQVPEEVELPYAVLTLGTTGDEGGVSSGSEVSGVEYKVELVTRGGQITLLEDQEKAMHAALQALAKAGTLRESWRLIGMERLSPTHAVEREGNTRFNRLGGDYRLTLYPEG